MLIKHEPEAEPFAGRLRGHERIKQARHHLFWNSRAAICNHDPASAILQGRSDVHPSPRTVSTASRGVGDDIDKDLLAARHWRERRARVDIGSDLDAARPDPVAEQKKNIVDRFPDEFRLDRIAPAL